MKRFALPLTLLIAGCGSSSTLQSSAFNNQTPATTTQLQALWGYAQQQLASQPIPIAPVTQGASTGYWRPDPRALSIQPDGLTVELGPAPYASNGSFRYIGETDSPSGWCDAETLSSSKIAVAPQWLLNPPTTGYEMENVILMRLGYNVSGR